MNNLNNFSNNSQQKIFDEFEEIIPMQLNEQQQNNNNQFYDYSNIKQTINSQQQYNQQSYFPPPPSIQQQQNNNQQQQSPLIHPQNSPSFHHSPIQLFNKNNHSPQPQTFNGNSQNSSINSLNQQKMSGQQFNFQHQNSQHFQQQFVHNQQNDWYQQQQQQQTYWQISPMRKESMPALHFNNNQTNHLQHHQLNNYFPQNLNDGIIIEEQKPSIIRSQSTAIFCVPSPSTINTQQNINNNSPNNTNILFSNSLINKNKQQDYRRTKSIVLPPTNINNRQTEIKNNFKTSLTTNSSNNLITHSLRRFNSQLRSPCRYSSDSLNSLPPFKPYTPPPILSPMRQGNGLFNKIASAQKEFRKHSALASTLVYQSANSNIGANGSNKNCKSALEEEKVLGRRRGVFGEEEKEIKEMPTRNLKNEIIVKEEIKEVVEEEEMRIDEDGKLKKGGEGREHQNGDLHSNNGMDGILLEGNTKITSSQTVTNGDVRPPRKNGILFSADGPSNSEFSFAAELEQLRKQSSSSHRSHKASIFGNSGRMSIRHGGKLSLGAFTSPNDDFIRKMSSVSMEEQQSSENGDGVEKPPESDAIPHINLGKNFQARVKKWADRAISSEEREAIPDRDERLFNSSSIEHISQQALAAYETLACSVALPKSGRNKELALHILAENRGNLQAAVMDLLRCDTLDWEQYPAIYNSRYVDVDNWSPEEIASFQDAIYKSEKDFQQVSSELGNRSIYECISFYYTWKKACPDDYRKLRNLRRKRQLLEQQLDLASFDIRQQKHPMKRMRCGIDGLITNLGEDENELLKLNGKHQQITSNEEDEELSETESDITNPSLLNVNIQGMECSSSSPNRKISSGHPIAPIPISFSSSSEGGGGISSLDQLSVLLGNHQQQNTPSKHFNFGSNNSLNNSNYPWLHGTDGIFPSPSSSTTSNNNETHFGGLETIIPTDYDGNNGRNNNHFGTNKIKGQHGANVKKGAQPQADGFFHCRLCEKRFEKVKSLNAHMKSHAMKARAEAEALQKTQQQHQQPLAFPVPTKKEIVSSSSLSLPNNQETNQAVAAAAAAAASNPLAGALVASSVALGMPPGLSGNAQVAAMAALNSLGRQMQQQQPFTCTNSGFGLLRDMLQYGQQQVAAAAVAANDAAQTNASAAAAAARWPGL